MTTSLDHKDVFASQMQEAAEARVKSNMANLAMDHTLLDDHIESVDATIDKLKTHQDDVRKLQGEIIALGSGGKTPTLDRIKELHLQARKIRGQCPV